MDIKIRSKSGNFKFRVGGIIKKGDKYLVVKMNRNDFYCLVGGHVGIGEDTQTAVVREIKEELCKDVRVVSLSAIIENFFTNKKGKKFHELCFAYKLEVLDEIEIKDFVRIENDNGEMVRLEFKWLTIEEMRQSFRPKILVDAIEKDEFAHLIKKEY